MSAMAALRDLMLSDAAPQTLIRAGAQRGLIPPRAYMRIQPYGAHPVTTPAGNTVTYVADGNDILARKIVWPTGWEGSSLQLFSELARDSEAVFDVGAFSGVYALVAAADSDAQVVAVEPNPVILPNLCRNVAANDLEERVRVVAAAVSDEPGRATLRVPRDTTAASLGGTGDPVDVDVVTLDELVDQPVGVMKVDVERREASALRGASRVLAEHRPHLIVELLSATAFDEVAGMLVDYGYSDVFHLAPEGPVPCTRNVTMPGWTNFWFPRP